MSNYTLVSQSVTIAGAAQTCTVAGIYITCPFVSMAAGATGSATIVLTPSQVGTFKLRISLYPLAGDINLDNNRSTRETLVTLATEDLQLTTNLSGSATRNLGGTPLYYSALALNAGPSNATNTRMTCTFTAAFNLDPGSSNECEGTPPVDNTVTCEIGALPSATNRNLSLRPIPTTVGPFGGSCSATSDLADSNPTNNTNIPLPTATINPALPVADLAVTLEAAAASGTVGNPLTYTVTINNTGPAEAASITISSSFTGGGDPSIASVSGRWSPDPATQPLVDLPTPCTAEQEGRGIFDDPSAFTRCTLATLPAGGRVVVTINATRATTGTLAHTASASASGSTDPQAGNNSVTLATPFAPPPVDLAIAMAATPDILDLFQELLYTLTVSNAGSPAENVVVTDTLPQEVEYLSTTATRTPPGAEINCSFEAANRMVTCPLGTMPVATEAALRITVRTNTPGDLINTATVAATPPDANAANNSVTLTTRVNAPVPVLPDCGNTVCDEGMGESCSACPDDCGPCGSPGGGEAPLPSPSPSPPPLIPGPSAPTDGGGGGGGGSIPPPAPQAEPGEPTPVGAGGGGGLFGCSLMPN